MLKTFFEYCAPTSLNEALDLLGRYREKAKILAGGTDLIIALQRGEISPEILVDIRKLKELRQIKKNGQYLVLGAAVTFNQLICHPLVKESVPLLVHAAVEIGSPQIRNLGTIGGNLGTASPAGDLLTPLIALEADVCLLKKEGIRRVLIDNFLGGRDWERLMPDEIIYEIRIPLANEKEIRSAFIKLGRRKALAISRLNLALYLEIEKEEKITKARLAVGAASPVPFRVTEAEKIFVQKGTRFDPEEIMELVSKAVADSLCNRPSAPYKTVAVKGLVWEALSICKLV